MLMLIATPDNGKNTKQRLGYLLGFGVTSGIPMIIAMYTHLVFVYRLGS